MSDLIDRQAAINAPVRMVSEGIEWIPVYHVEQLPSAQPERIKGKWIPFGIPWYQCSECGAIRENKTFMENFCPNCGADMRGEQDG